MRHFIITSSYFIFGTHVATGHTCKCHYYHVRIYRSAWCMWGRSIDTLAISISVIFVIQNAVYSVTYITPKTHGPLSVIFSRRACNVLPPTWWYKPLVNCSRGQWWKNIAPIHGANSHVISSNESKLILKLFHRVHCTSSFFEINLWKFTIAKCEVGCTWISSIQTVEDEFQAHFQQNLSNSFGIWK